ncbi:MAG: hypothetical protein VKJ64_10860 [Leptolyngbyaceae bacterium]|nr:hypothetical protein [Leptolyngbyaceae bacterium]
MLETEQTVDEIYAAITHRLSLTERLRLATLLLNDLAQSDVAVIDQSDGWSEVDQQEAIAFALKKGKTEFPDQDEALQAPEPKPSLMAKLRQVKIAARPTGLCSGDFVVPEDFDEPLPDAILDEFEGE